MSAGLFFVRREENLNNSLEFHLTAHDRRV